MGVHRNGQRHKCAHGIAESRTGSRTLWPEQGQNATQRFTTCVQHINHASAALRAADEAAETFSSPSCG